MTRILWPIALLAACNGNKDEPAPTTGDTGDTDTVEQVMRNCPPDKGNICPWAGAGVNGKLPVEDGVHRLDMWFSYPMSVAFPPPGVPGRPIIADWNNHKLRAVNENPEDGFETIMGTDFLGDGDADLKDRTPEGADGTSVALNHPTQQMYFSDGTLLSDSWHTHKFRTWDPATGKVHVVLGSRAGMTVDENGAPIDFDQPAATALLNQPKELYIDHNNENLVYYVDMRNERIRVWDRAAGLINTIMGETVDVNGDGAVGSKNYCGEGDALQTCVNFPKNANPEPGGAIALSADSTKMYIADSENHVIRVLDLTTGQVSLLSGKAPTLEDVDADGDLADWNEKPAPGVRLVTYPGFQDGPANQAQWYYPSDFALDHDTNELFVADTNNHRIRKIDLNTMEVTTVAGNGTPPCELIDLLVPEYCVEQHAAGDGGPAIEANLYRPFGVDLDPDGNLVISDTYNHRIRIVYR